MSRGVGLSPILGLVPWELDGEADELVPPELRSPWVMASSFLAWTAPAGKYPADEAASLVAESPDLSCLPCTLGPLEVSSSLGQMANTLEGLISPHGKSSAIDRMTWRMVTKKLGMIRPEEITIWQALAPSMTSENERVKLGRSAIGRTIFANFLKQFETENSIHAGFAVLLLLVMFGPGPVEDLWRRMWVEDVKLTLAQAYFALKTDHTAPLAWAGVLA